MVEICFDGGCEPVNPCGVATYGYVLKRDGNLLEKGHGVAIVGEGATNNVAEYTGLIKGVEAVRKHLVAGEPLKIRGDSQLVIRQLKGEYAVNAPLLKPLHLEAGKAIARASALVDLEWIPREQNSEADKETKEAVLEAFRSDPKLSEKVLIKNGKYAGRTLAQVDDGYYRWAWQRSGLLPERGR